MPATGRLGGYCSDFFVIREGLRPEFFIRLGFDFRSLLSQRGGGPEAVEGSLIEIGEIAAAIPLSHEGTSRSAPGGRAEAPPFPIKGSGPAVAEGPGWG